MRYRSPPQLLSVVDDTCLSFVEHLTNPSVALTTLVAALRPGGWLLVESSDPKLQPLACPDEVGPSQALANKLRNKLWAGHVELGAGTPTHISRAIAGCRRFGVPDPTVASALHPHRRGISLAGKRVDERDQLGAVTITVGSSYPLAEAARAHRDLHERKNIGAVVLLPAIGTG